MAAISKKNNQPIGVFDSGVGGLSVLRELQKKMPHENFVFLADQKYVPYGEKTKKELVSLVYKITDYLIKHHDIKMMVVACNTATCGAIAELRNKYSLPIVGTVPAIKPAAEKTRTKTVGIISTPSTSKSKVLHALIKDYCRGVKMLNIGCKNLEDVVEKGKLNSPEVSRLLVKFLKKVKDSKADYLVLGCTHYPFLKNIIQKIVGPRINLIDSGNAIAKHTRSLLANNFLENNQKRSGETSYLTTGNPVEFSKVSSFLLKNAIKAKRVKI